MSSVWRRAFYVVVAVMIYGAVGAWLSSVVPAGAQSEKKDLQAEAEKAVTAFFKAIVEDDEDALAAMLAPEFQIMRSDGTHYDAKGYLASDLPIIAEVPAITNLVVTASDGTVVTTYSVTANETIDGQVVETFAPRLTVFRAEDGQWIITAHGNFAALN